MSARDVLAYRVGYLEAALERLARDHEPAAVALTDYLEAVRLEEDR